MATIKQEKMLEKLGDKWKSVSYEQCEKIKREKCAFCQYHGGSVIKEGGKLRCNDVYCDYMEITGKSRILEGSTPLTCKHYKDAKKKKAEEKEQHKLFKYGLPRADRDGRYLYKGEMVSIEELAQRIHGSREEAKRLIWQADKIRKSKLKKYLVDGEWRTVKDLEEYWGITAGAVRARVFNQKIKWEYVYADKKN